MNDDWLWKTAYRIYIFAVFTSSAALIAYLLLKAGYVPMSMQNILELSVPGLIYFAPIVSIIWLAVFALAVFLEEFLDSIKKSLYIYAIIAGIMAVGIFGVIVWSMHAIFRLNIIFWISVIIIAVSALIFRHIIYKEKSIEKKKTFTFILAVLFCLFLGVVEYIYASSLFIKEHLATVGYGRLLIKQNTRRPVLTPMFFRRPYGYDCIPSFIRLDDGLFLLQSARILFQSGNDTLVQYIGFTHGNVPYLHAKNRHQIVFDEKMMCGSKIDLSSSVVRYSDAHKNPMRVCQKIVNQSGKDRVIGLKKCATDLQNLITHK